ncbi:MAG: PilZ domain-containing protein [Sphingomonadaceae bacterium]
MSASEARHIGRDSLFLMADMRIDGAEGEYRIKVRNLSDGGMMGEGPVRVVRGAVVDINLRNCGWVEGTVAWVEGNRFGVAFRDEIDAKIARSQTTSSDAEDLHTPAYLRYAAKPTPADTSKLRKI